MVKTGDGKERFLLESTTAMLVISKCVPHQILYPCSNSQLSFST